MSARSKEGAGAAEAVRSLFPDLVDAVDDPSRLADELYKAKLVSVSTVGDMSTLGVGKYDKSRTLMISLQSRLQNNPSDFKMIMSVFEKSKALRPGITDELKQAYQQFAVPAGPVSSESCQEPPSEVVPTISILAEDDPMDCTVLAPIFEPDDDPLDFYALGDINKTWNKNTLKVYFMSDSVDTHRQVLEWASEWSKHCNLQFQPTDDSVNNDIRVDFKPGSSKSCVGLTANDKPKNESTMNLGVMKRHKVLHEFGHALGLEHEHQHPDVAFEWNEAQVYADMQAKGWSDERTRNNILKNVPIRNPATLKRTDYDVKSIMHYPINPKWIVGNAYPNGITRNYELSDNDKKLVKELYGPPQTEADRAMYANPVGTNINDARLNEKLSPRDVQNVVKEVLDWRTLAGFMDLSDVDQARIDERKGDARVLVIQLWQRKLGSRATFQALVTLARDDMGDETLAEHIEMIAKKK